MCMVINSAKPGYKANEPETEDKTVEAKNKKYVPSMRGEFCITSPCYIKEDTFKLANDNEVAGVTMIVVSY